MAAEPERDAGSDPADKKRAMQWEAITIWPKAAAEDSVAAERVPALAVDGDAFAGFYSRAARPLWAYIARVSGDPGLADDLMQESFVRFLCATRQPLAKQGEVAARRYLFRIATNLLRDHWRHPVTRSIEDMPEDSFAAKAGVSDDFGLVAAMASMGSRQRQLLWLAHAEGYSHKEIAEITGLGPASIRLLLFRARRKLAKLLREPRPMSSNERSQQ
jgi:RNA polymerase sigma-70 factor (ECF subfamily)